MDFRISEFMDARCVQLELAARNKEEAVEELVRLLADAGKLDGVERYVEEVLERERISSTGIGQGIAIPHRLVAGVGEIIIAVGRNGKGVPFDTVDRKPAHLIFLIIGPQGHNSRHLMVLSKLSRYLNDRGFFEALMKAREAGEVIELVKEKER
jgi:fructose-specific phosphotransferase system IIA component